MSSSGASSFGVWRPVLAFLPMDDLVRMAATSKAILAGIHDAPARRIALIDPAAAAVGTETPQSTAHKWNRRPDNANATSRLRWYPTPRWTAGDAETWFPSVPGDSLDALCRAASSSSAAVVRRSDVVAVHHDLLDLSLRWTCEQLAQACATFHQLESLHLAMCQYPYPTQPPIPDCDVVPLAHHWKIKLPPSLRHLSLYWFFVLKEDQQVMLNALPGAQHLHTVALRDVNTWTKLDPLAKLPNLTSLTIAFKEKIILSHWRARPPLHTKQTLTDLLAPIAKLYSLTSLSINSGKLTQREFSYLPTFMPKSLTFFDLSETKLSKGYLALLHQRLPHLTSLAPFGFKCKGLHDLRLFDRLTSIRFDAGLWASHWIEERHVLEPLGQCPTLTHVEFNTASLQSAEGWRALFEQLPKLRSLALGAACPKPWTCTKVPIVQQRLQRLHVQDVPLTEADIAELRRDLPGCEISFDLPSSVDEQVEEATPPSGATVTT